MIICGTGSYLVLFELFSVSRSSLQKLHYSTPETVSRWIFGALNRVRALLFDEPKKHQHTRSKRHIQQYSVLYYAHVWYFSSRFSLSSLYNPLMYVRWYAERAKPSIVVVGVLVYAIRWEMTGYYSQDNHEQVKCVSIFKYYIFYALFFLLV